MSNRGESFVTIWQIILVIFFGENFWQNSEHFGGKYHPLSNNLWVENPSLRVQTLLCHQIYTFEARVLSSYLDLHWWYQKKIQSSQQLPFKSEFSCETYNSLISKFVKFIISNITTSSCQIQSQHLDMCEEYGYNTTISSDYASSTSINCPVATSEELSTLSLLSFLLDGVVVRFIISSLGMPHQYSFLQGGSCMDSSTNCWWCWWCLILYIWEQQCWSPWSSLE